MYTIKSCSLFLLLIFLFPPLYGQIELVVDARDEKIGLSPSSFVEFKDRLYFSGTSAEFGEEMWVTDGTLEGTKLFFDVTEGLNGFRPGNYVVVGDELFFRVRAVEGRDQFWKTDGTAENTIMVVDFEDISGMISVGNLVVFSGKSDADMNSFIYLSDGTKEGTKMIDLDFSSVVFRPQKFNDVIYFVAGKVLHTIDGSGLVTEVAENVNSITAVGDNSSSLIIDFDDFDDDARYGILHGDSIHIIANVSSFAYSAVSLDSTIFMFTQEGIYSVVDFQDTTDVSANKN